MPCSLSAASQEVPSGLRRLSEASQSVEAVSSFATQTSISVSFDEVSRAFWHATPATFAVPSFFTVNVSFGIPRFSALPGSTTE